MSGRKHILFISSWYPNRNNITHGIFNKAFAEAAALYNRVSVLHVCSDAKINTDFEVVEAIENNIHTIIVYYRKVSSTLPLFAQLLKRNKILNSFEIGYHKLIAKAGKPDLIQLNVALPAGLGVTMLSKKYNIPYVVNEGWTGYSPEDGNYTGFFTKFFTKKILSGASTIMPVSKHLMTAMQNHGLDGNYRIVPNVVDTENFFPQTQLQSENNLTTFIHISTLDDPQKNVRGIIRAFAIALKTDQNMQLLIVGEGDEKNRLEALVKNLNIHTNVIFTGRLLMKELAKKINQSDALVMFSNYETFCLTVAESLACGKPVITSRAGGLTNMIDASLGESLAVKDETKLAEILAGFKHRKRQYDPKILRAFVTSNFTPDRIGQQLDEIYTSVLKNKQQ